MDKFLPYNDSLAKQINSEAEKFYWQLKNLQIDSIGLNGWILDYFKKSHVFRTFFSVQTSAELLYRSIKYLGKTPEDATVMDYGAGVGSLYLLAKKIGCKKVVYNDIIPEVKNAGELVAKALGIKIDEYILGDHISTLEQLKEKNIECDIVLSRNVIEHIYDLKDYYAAMMKYLPNALHFSSTSANYHNPITLYMHKKMHRKVENEYIKDRIKYINEHFPEITENEIHKIASQIRGLAGKDIHLAIENYKKDGKLPDPSIHGTNTCEHIHGIWAEHIIPESEYKRLLEPLGYYVEIIPGFWDTHYSKGYKNLVGTFFNSLSKFFGKSFGMKTSAFIYVILQKKNRL